MADTNQNNVVDNIFKNLSKFKLDKILNNNTNFKSICLLGKFDNKPEQALILLEKPAFCENDVNQAGDNYLKEENFLELEFQNDIYYKYNFFPNIKLNHIKSTVIYPATNKHIEKYSIQNIHIVNETPELYQTITLPYLQQQNQFSLDWVFNILEHKSEVDRIEFEDPDPNTGFILLPDIKWDRKSHETLHLLCLVHPRGIKSLRDLNASHLPLLKNIYNKGVKEIEKKYGLPEDQLRIYFHYQPTFYHLHVHFTYLRFDAPGIYAGKAHLLREVIGNIELMSDYYQKATLCFTLRELDGLFRKYEENNCLKKIIDNSELQGVKRKLSDD